MVNLIIKTENMECRITFSDQLIHLHEDHTQGHILILCFTPGPN